MTTDGRPARVLVVDDQPAKRCLAPMPGFAPRAGDAAGVLH